MDINLATFRVIGLLLKLFLFPLWQLLIYLFGYAINLLPKVNIVKNLVEFGSKI